MGDFNPNIADHIIQQMLSYLGQGEEPPGSNRGPIPDKAYKFVHGPNADPAKDTVADREWCAELVCMVVFEAGIKDGPRTASTGAIHTWGTVHDRLVDIPQRGDIGCVLATPDKPTPTGFQHTVLVEHNTDNATIHCISGNEGNKVARSLVPMRDMRFVRPY